MTPILRPHALCDARDPICPRCGHPLVGRFLQKPDGLVVSCMNRMERAGVVETCGQRVVILASHSMAIVVGLERAEFDQLLVDERSLKEGMRELGILTGRVA